MYEDVKNKEYSIKEMDMPRKNYNPKYKEGKTK